MRKILTIILALILCFAMNLTSFAESETYIYDEAGILNSETSLNEKAASIKASSGIIVSYVVTKAEGSDDIIAYGEKLYKKHYGNSAGILLCETPSEWYMHRVGKAKTIFTDNDKNALWDACASSDNYDECVAAYLDKAEEILKSKNIVAAKSEQQSKNTSETEKTTASDHPSRLVDSADILSSEEEADLVKKLDKVSENQDVDVAIVTVSSLEGKDVQAYADDYYDYNGYGMGTDDDGLLLLIGMDEHQSAISTYGFAITAFTVDGMDYIFDQITSYMSEDEYVEAFNEFVTLSDDYITQAKTGEPYDTGNLPDDVEVTFMGLLRLLIFALIVAALISLVLKNRKYKKLKSVKMRSDAAEYLSDVKIVRQHDRFLYRTVSQVKKSSNNGSGGSGSGAHVSSSGRTHGGSSRGF